MNIVRYEDFNGNPKNWRSGSHLIIRGIIKHLVLRFDSYFAFWTSLYGTLSPWLLIDPHTSWRWNWFSNFIGPLNRIGDVAKLWCFVAMLSGRSNCSSRESMAHILIEQSTVQICLWELFVRMMSGRMPLGTPAWQDPRIFLKQNIRISVVENLVVISHMKRPCSNNQRGIWCLLSWP